jgi:hypothetical protein
MSYNCDNYNCGDDIGDHELNTCSEELRGGGSSVIFFECNTEITDYTSSAQILAEIAAGRANLFSNVKIGIDAGSPITADALQACSTQTLISYDRTFSLIDANVNSNNTDLYNTLFAGRKFGSALIYICGTTDADAGAKTILIDSEVKGTGSLIVPNTDQESMRFEGSFSWRKKAGPLLLDAPTGVF